MVQEEYPSQSMKMEVDEPVIKHIPSDNEDSCKSNEEIAASLKQQGNSFYVKKEYRKALNSYTQAIELDPLNCAYYSNRAATYMMLYNFINALDDSRRSVELDPSFSKGHIREAKCHMAIGDPVSAIRCYEKINKPSNDQKTGILQAKTLGQLEEKANSSYHKGDFRQAAYCMDRCLEISHRCTKYRILKAECLALLQRYEEASATANEILREDSTNCDAIYVRGLCLYGDDIMDKAFQHFQQVLRFNPDHNKAKLAYKKAKLLNKMKNDGNDAFKNNKLDDALTLYQKALEVDPLNSRTNAKLHNNRATTLCRLKRYAEAIKACDSALALDKNYTKAQLRRAKCLLEDEQYDEAVRDYEKIFKINRTHENKALLEDAKLELKKSKRKDYYKILNILKTANEKDIKKAYRKHALIHHPDRHASETEEKKSEEEKKFKEIGEAYAVLSDEKKRHRYDNGLDIEDGMGVGSGMQMDPNQIFSMFFSGGGGGVGGGGFGGGGFSTQSRGFSGFSGSNFSFG